MEDKKDDEVPRGLTREVNPLLSSRQKANSAVALSIQSDIGKGIIYNIRLSRWYLAYCFLMAIATVCLVVFMIVDVHFVSWEAVSVSRFRVWGRSCSVSSAAEGPQAIRYAGCFLMMLLLVLPRLLSTCCTCIASGHMHRNCGGCVSMNDIWHRIWVLNAYSGRTPFPSGSALWTAL